MAASLDAVFQISIHALREEGDKLLVKGLRCKADFYPRPPRGGRRSSEPELTMGQKFLSTPSARRATSGDVDGQRVIGISIHALREEGDICTLGYDQLAQIFLSTPSARRATRDHTQLSPHHRISIHALREEGDKSQATRWAL